MTDSLNVNDNLYKASTAAKEFNKDPTDDMVPVYEEITVTKPEVKEELYDFEISLDEMECTNAKEERTFSPVIIFEEEQCLNAKEECTYIPEIIFDEKNLELITSPEQSSNENLVSGISQLREEDLQQKQKLSTKRLHLKHNKAERTKYLKRPIGKHHGETNEYKCTHCTYAAHIKHDLERHIRTHTNNRPFKCIYKNCECTPGQEESCKCSMCGYAAAREDRLQVHILTKHTANPKKYKCSMCEYATARKATLKVHILNKHSPEPKYKCADCNYTTRRKHHLEQHIRMHTNYRPFKCTYKNCECTAGQEESCKCSTCGYATAQKINLKLHILAKHTAEPKSTSLQIAPLT